MDGYPRTRTLLLTLASAVLFSCTPDQADRRLHSPTAPSAANEITEGYDLGFTYSACVSSITTDADFDLLDDTCEKELAIAFNPQLVLHTNDVVTREPAYAANKRGVGTNTVAIIYMLSYHEDLGGQGFLKPVVSQAHHGDSELIDIRISESGGIWKINDVFLSAHYQSHSPLGQQTDFSRIHTYDQLEYADNYRGRPRIWVAVDKHANYASNYLCNNSNAWDSCASAPPAIYYEDALGWGDLQNRNVGSAGAPMMNVVASQVPSVRPGTEAYWSQVKHFWGWAGSGKEDKATPYWKYLGEFGYNESWVPPGPLGVTIDGPTLVRAGNNCNWLASTTGGAGTFSYEWLRNDSIVSVGQNYAGNTGTTDFTLSLRVTDGTGVFEDYATGVGISGSAEECTEEFGR
jgi:hypothetical protein